MDNLVIIVYIRLIRPFRSIFNEDSDGPFVVNVIGFRMSFAEPVASKAAISWFCFYFHHPVIVTTATGEVACPSETVLLVAPGQPLAHRPRGNVLARSWIRCAGTRVAGMVADAGLQARIPYALSPDSEALSALLALHRACVHPRRTVSGHIESLFRTWLYGVARDAGPSTGAHAGMDAVRQHLDATHMQPQRLDDLAALAGCSRAQLCRRFRQVVGMSPIQYVLHLRLETARELLLTTERDVESIAQDCGFSDRYHLSRAFSARYGMGPATCRRNALHG